MIKKSKVISNTNPIIVSIVGARPQFIKIATFAKKLKKSFVHIIIHTGQHYDERMSGIFFKTLNIPSATYHLGITSKFNGDQIGRMIIEIEKILLKERPDLVVVYGDTNSTLAGAIATKKSGKLLVHIESGMRSGDRTMPEELNRIITDHCSDLLFCPSKKAIQNLRSEKIRGQIFFTGDIMRETFNNIFRSLPSIDKLRAKIGLDNKKFTLLTLHRAGNVDNKKRFKAILEGISSLPTNIIFPIHPRSKKMLIKLNLNKFIKSNVKIINPLPYDELICLAKNSQMVLTDSGGLQKEAYYLKTPCLTIRDNTEWAETLKTGWNRLTKANKNDIKKKYFQALTFHKRYDRNLYMGTQDPVLAIKNFLKKNT